MIDTPEQIAAILQREYDAADSYYEQIEELQKQAFDYYEGKPLGTEVEGRSQIVLPDVQTAIDYMVQSVLRTFASGDRVIEFEAEDDGDDQSAEDATAAVDYYFMRKQDGYRVLYDVLNDGCLRKLGVMKAVAEQRERITRETRTGPMEEIGLLEEDAEIEDVTPNDDGTFTVKIKRTYIETCYTGQALPLRYFRFSPRAKHEDTAGYVAHVEPKTRGELVEMGFDREQVYSLPRYNDNDLEYYESDQLDYFNDEETSPAVELVELCEEYARIDVDGDGIAERVKAFRVENEILRWQGEPVIDEETGEQAVDEQGEPAFEEGELAVETVDDQPFAVFCPFPRPHALIGYSLADKVMDIQYLRTMIARQMIDGMAFSNLPRLVVSEQGSADETLDDILSPIPGAPIRTKAQGAVQPLQNSFNVGQSLTVLEWATGEGEKRTGITAMNQGLDADAINKTASGTAMMQAAGQQIEEAVARQMAEAFGRLCVKIYRMMRDNGEGFTIRVDGQPRQVDPSQWPDKMHVRPRVGLGTGSKDKRIQARMALYQPMTAAIAEGMAGPEHAFKWMDGIARDTGIGQGDDFMFTPEQLAEKAQAAPPEQDPEMAKVEAEMAMQQAKIQGEQQLAQMRMQLQREEAEAKAQLERERAEFEAQLAREKAQFEADMAVEKMQIEARLKQQMAETAISQNRDGGRLDA
jgi:hypothetical protein